MRRLIRFLAVIALALSPVWGVPEVHAASSPAPARFPYWPSFYSNGCSAVTGPFGGVTFSCGTGAYATTQITSAYGGCSQINIDVNGFGSGPFITSATAPVGGIQNTITIDGSGNYYMQISWVPNTTIGPIAIQFSTPDTGNMSLETLTVTPCPVATSTPTVNPSFTPTNTPVPVTGTPTPIPTFTPLPSGHSTFTRTPTMAPGTNTATPTITATPGPSTRDCGLPSFPLLDCDASNSVWNSIGSPWFGTPNFYYSAPNGVELFSQTHVFGSACGRQSVIAHATGSVFVEWSQTNGGGSNPPMQISLGACGSSGTIYHGSIGDRVENLGGVTSGSTYTISFSQSGAGDGANTIMDIVKTWVGGTANTPTPGPTDTVTATLTPVPGTATNTPIPSDTPISIPGAHETAIPTSTECPGGCAVKALTAVPGMATIVKVDTSPFDPLKNLSLTRSTCQPFGWAQIPVPVIHGTPALGSTTPLSYTWTAPITGAWANTDISGTLILTNTALQPCAMSEIPSFVWDLTYWLSVLLCAIGWFMWLIGFVGRLSGEETING